MHYLLTGAHGMLGRDIQRVLSGTEASVTAAGHNDLDITQTDAVRRAVASHDVAINCAAVTKVDDAEKNEELAYAVNARGAHNLALACAEADTILIQISTDYVFDGKATAPYAEDAPRSPLSVYGRSKAEGEILVQEAHPEGSYIVRTAWLYGEHGENFATTILNRARSHKPLRVTNDQRGQPTWTLDLAHQLLSLVEHKAPAGIYHASNSGEATRFEFAQAILEGAKLDATRVEKTTSDSLKRPAARPSYSVLGHSAWGHVGIPEMRHWREALHAAFTHGALNI